MSSSELFFFKGQINVIENSDNGKEPIDKIKESFNKILDGKNLSFLLGSGCSSYQTEIQSSRTKEKSFSSVEVGIPTMLPLAKEFYTSELNDSEKKWLKGTLLIDIDNNKFLKNIEFFLGVLHSYKFYLSNTISSSSNEIKLERLENIILKAKNFLIRKCLNEDNRNSGKDYELSQLYEKFYRKLLYRNSNLPKANIFTTNYDLYSETALDKLGIHYVNGFSGGIKKYFNPTIFNYALAEKMDLSQSKWNVIDNFFYLYKIHGSINWIEDVNDSKLFKVREIQETSYNHLKSQGTTMIHPTPLKQNASLGSPYADLFREFQKKLMQNNNILITLGYSFSDEHINNLIYQAFTIPSFRLIIMGDPVTGSEIAKLKSLDDPRVWIVGGIGVNKRKLHYFEGFVNDILPDLSNEQIDNKIEQAIKTLLIHNDQR